MLISIRRRLNFILSLTLVMLVVFSVTGMLSVRVMRRLVTDLDVSIRSAPHRAELLASIGSFCSLLMTFPESNSSENQQDWFNVRKQEIAERVEDLRTEADRFRIRLQETLVQQSASATEQDARLLQEVEQQVRYIHEAVPHLEDAEKRQPQVRWLVQLTSRLFEAVRDVPDPADRLLPKLQKARQDAEFQTSVIVLTAVIGVAVTLWMSLALRRWILHPIRTLKNGAYIVSQGNYHFRLALQTRDELAELAQMFNTVTERFEAEVDNRDKLVREQTQQLLQSERLAGVGFLASGVAHEINNPLSAITACTGIIHDRFQSPPASWSEQDISECQEYLQLIHQESQRCQGITRKMLDFAHGSNDERNLYDVTAIVEDVVSMVKHLGEFHDRKISVNRTAPCEAWINGQEIKQVILNLVANALQATGSGGKLDIRIHEQAGGVEIEFQDNGSGMTPEIIQHIFDPFFTTKDVGKGTGMGLSISRTLLQSHGGTLEATSEGLGRGSTFRVRLPNRAPLGLPRAA